MPKPKNKKWKKSSAELVGRFLEATEDLPGVEHRKMFGYPCCFINGNMFTGLHEERMVLRLDQKGRDKLVEIGGVPFEPWPGRSMKEYIVVPKAILQENKKMKKWLLESMKYVSSIVPKKKVS